MARARLRLNPKRSGPPTGSRTLQGGAYFKSGKYVYDAMPQWKRCGDCQALVLPGSPELHDGDCHNRAMMLRFGIGGK